MSRSDLIHLKWHMGDTSAFISSREQDLLTFLSNLFEGGGELGEEYHHIQWFKSVTCLSLRCHCWLTAGISVGGRGNCERLMCVNWCFYISIHLPNPKGGWNGEQTTGSGRGLRGSLGRSQSVWISVLAWDGGTWEEIMIVLRDIISLLVFW